ncbi:solute carrier family 25 [Vigna unguiculata]|uniref:Solute carrier family 25 n=1 Tax=Vigna unguiculata TaxID=3917 RepID=A0A4D6LUS5_VIGUN|nr:solute carrier family 25 [Vigna unguiculata]
MISALKILFLVEPFTQRTLKGSFMQEYGSFLLRDLPFDDIELCIYEQLGIGYKLAAKRDPNDP